MAEQRLFFYSGDVDDNYKAAAKKSLEDAGWIPQQEFTNIQMLTCTAPERQSCTPLHVYPYVILAQR